MDWKRASNERALFLTISKRTHKELMDKKKKLDVDKRIKPVDNQRRTKNKNPGQWSDKVTLASVSSSTCRQERPPVRRGNAPKMKK